MKGLKIFPFEEKNVEQFEHMLIYWTRTCAERFFGSVMLFDKYKLLVGETSMVDNDKHLYRVKLPRLYIEYICISGDMCIMSKVVRTDRKEEELLYEIPDRWAANQIWYAT